MILIAGLIIGKWAGILLNLRQTKVKMLWDSITGSYLRCCRVERQQKISIQGYPCCVHSDDDISYIQTPKK